MPVVNHLSLEGAGPLSRGAVDFRSGSWRQVSATLGGDLKSEVAT